MLSQNHCLLYFIFRFYFLFLRLISGSLLYFLPHVLLHFYRNTFVRGLLLWQPQDLDLHILLILRPRMVEVICFMENYHQILLVNLPFGLNRLFLSQGHGDPYFLNHHLNLRHHQNPHFSNLELPFNLQLDFFIF